MVLKIPEAGLVLDGSARMMAGLPQQAFAVTLSDSVIEHMIECVQDGQDIQLSLGSNPSFIYDEEELKIVDSQEIFDYDIFYSKTAHPNKVNRLPNPAMSIFRMPKPWEPRPNKAPKPKAKAPPKAAASIVSRDKTPVGGEIDDAVAKLQESMARAEADKIEKSYGSPSEPDKELRTATNLTSRARLVDGTVLGTKGGKAKPGAKSKFLTTQVTANPRSHPASPALTGIGSPLAGSTSGGSQDDAKRLRFSTIHELALQDQDFESLLSKFPNPDNETEFRTVLSKVADFDDTLQKWCLKKLYWKELDVFEYPYSSEKERTKAIENAIRQYDRMRLGASEPLWQKLLPKAQRGQGKCLSHLQPHLAGGLKMMHHPVVDGSSGSGAESEREDALGVKKKGGEAMARTGSGQGKKKISASEAQQKRLFSTNKKASASPAARPSPKVSPTKPTTAKKAAAAPPKMTSKDGRGALSKEFISDSSDSDDETAPLSATAPKARAALKERNKLKATPATTEREKVREPEKPREVEKPREKVRETPAARAKPVPKPVRDTDRDRDTIRAQVVAKPLKVTKRPREDDEDNDSSSSGTPLSKRFKPKSVPIKAPALHSNTHRGSDASQHSRASSGVSYTKSKNTSPLKSSPLASSPPTNASDIDQDRGRSHERERDRNRDTIVSSGLTAPKKRRTEDYMHAEAKKRPKLSPEILTKANKFKQFYSRYETLHRQLMALEDPPEAKMADLLDMHERLAKMKSEIYREASVER